MGLSQIIEFIRSREKELAIINNDPADPLRNQLEAHFATQNVRIRSYTTASGTPADIAVLSTDEEVLEITPTETLRGLVDSFQSPDAGNDGAAGESHALLRHLKETTFTSYDTQQMLYASREIEDRARRVGHGTVHAGFQRCSVMATQHEIYTDLTRQGLDVHLYGVPDTSPPPIEDAVIHTDDTDEIAHTWFVIFDGGSKTAQKSALLAEQRAPDTFYGLWTYDEKIVDSAIGYLNRTYLVPDDTQSTTQS